MAMSFGSAYSTAVEIGSAFANGTFLQVLKTRKASWRESISIARLESIKSFMNFAFASAIGNHYRLSEVREFGRPKSEKHSHDETRYVCGMGFSIGRLDLRFFKIAFLPYKWVGRHREEIKINIGLCALPSFDTPGSAFQEEQQWFIASVVCVKNGKGQSTGVLFVDQNVDAPR